MNFEQTHYFVRLYITIVHPLKAIPLFYVLESFAMSFNIIVIAYMVSCVIAMSQLPSLFPFQHDLALKVMLRSLSLGLSGVFYSCLSPYINVCIFSLTTV